MVSTLSSPHTPPSYHPYFSNLTTYQSYQRLLQKKNTKSSAATGNPRNQERFARSFESRPVAHAARVRELSASKAIALAAASEKERRTISFICDPLKFHSTIGFAANLQ